MPRSKRSPQAKKALEFLQKFDDGKPGLRFMMEGVSQQLTKHFGKQGPSMFGALKRSKDIQKVRRVEGKGRVCLFSVTRIKLPNATTSQPAPKPSETARPIGKKAAKRRKAKRSKTKPAESKAAKPDGSTLPELMAYFVEHGAAVEEFLTRNQALHRHGYGVTISRGKVTFEKISR